MLKKVLSEIDIYSDTVQVIKISTALFLKSV